MKCKRCGREFTGNFCPQCGQRAEETERPVQRNRCAGRSAENQCIVCERSEGTVEQVVGRNVQQLAQQNDFFVVQLDLSALVLRVIGLILVQDCRDLLLRQPLRFPCGF